MVHALGFFLLRVEVSEKSLPELLMGGKLYNILFKIELLFVGVLDFLFFVLDNSKKLQSYHVM